MKKILTYSVLLLVVTIVTVSGTYAVFTASNSGDVTDVGSHQIQVRYSGDTEITGYIELVEKKEDGFRRTVSIAKGEDSVDVSANIYIHLEQIDIGFASKGLKWEIYELVDNPDIKNEENEVQNEEQEEIPTKIEKYVDSGTFEGRESGERVYMIQNLELTEETKTYAIYLWLNGHEAANEVVGAVFRGYIGAETNEFTSTITE